MKKAPSILLILLSVAALCQKLVDINKAGEDELAALPQIGKTLARKIVAHRPYASIDDLARADIPAPTRELLKSKVIVSRTLDEKSAGSAGNISAVRKEPSSGSGVRTRTTPRGSASAASVGAASKGGHSVSQEAKIQAMLAEAQAEKAAAYRAMSEALQDRMEAERIRTEAYQAMTEARQDRVEAERIRTGAYQARAEAERALMAAEAARQGLSATSSIPDRTEKAAEERQQLVEELAQIVKVDDTPRGIIATIPIELFSVGQTILSPEAKQKLAKIAGVILAHPGLKIDIRASQQSAGRFPLPETANLTRRADAVLGFLLVQGLPASSLTAAVQYRATPGVDLIISGDALGKPAPR